MSDLKQLRNRVKSIKSTQKITKAMNVVSAAKLKKVKEQAEKLNNYSPVLADIMYDISVNRDLGELPENDRKFFSCKVKNTATLLVLMTSERGLCGSFNFSLIRKIKTDIATLENNGRQVKLLIIGKKGRDALKAKYSHMIAGYYHVEAGNYEYVSRAVQDKIISMVEQGEAGACYMYYNKFKNAITQLLTVKQVLPVKSDKDLDDSKYLSKYEYEGAGLVHNLINLYIHGEINYGMLQSRTSVEGARMTAMVNASINAVELIDKLTLK
jgi:F-type H+-transporting ATPase subunit gamma